MGKINENIKNFRTFRGIKQQDLADALNRSKSVISNWERGENSPDIDTCEKLCKILKVTPNELFGWEVCREYEQWKKEAYQLETELAEMVHQKRDMELRIQAYQKRLNEMRSSND